MIEWRSIVAHSASCRLAAVLLVVSLGAPHANAGGPSPTVIHVNDDADAGGDGASWNSALRHLQDGLSTALVEGADEVWVAGGTYRPDRGVGQVLGDPLATFLIPAGLIVRGGYAGDDSNPDARDVDAFVTTLCGDLAANDLPGSSFLRMDNSRHVVTCVDPDVELDGVRVVRGNAVEVTPPGGGGILVEGGSVTIRASVLTSNYGGEGGALGIGGGGHVTIDGCRFLENHAIEASGRGGAVHVEQATLVVSGCLFEGNTSSGRAGAVSLATAADAEFEASRFEANVGATGGGGIDATDCTAVFRRCHFLGNEATAAFGFGGACRTQGASVDIINSVLADNRAAFGGGTFTSTGVVRLINSTIIVNESVNPGGGVYASGADLTVSNTILWDNVGGEGEAAQITVVGSGTVALNASCVQGLSGALGGVGNIGDDPLFLDVANGRSQLRPESPCVDTGDNPLLPAGNDEDLAGGVRVVDGDDDGVPVVDMGAFEFVFVDCDGDGVDDNVQIVSGGGADCNENGALDTCDIAGGVPDCNENGVPDSCDAAVGLDCNQNMVPDECEPDCNENGIPDTCDVASEIELDSGTLTPFGFPFPQSMWLDGLRALSDVTIEVTARANLDAPDEFVRIVLAGTELAPIFIVGGEECPSTAQATQFVLSDVEFNEALPISGGNLELLPTNAVSLFCTAFTSVSVRVSYVARSPSDLNGNGVPDDCECFADLDGSGDVAFSDVLRLVAAWGRCAACPEDLDGNGRVDFRDLFALLGTWGEC